MLHWSFLGQTRFSAKWLRCRSSWRKSARPICGTQQRLLVSTRPLSSSLPVKQQTMISRRFLRLVTMVSPNWSRSTKALLLSKRHCSPKAWSLSTVCYRCVLRIHRFCVAELIVSIFADCRGKRKTWQEYRSVFATIVPVFHHQTRSKSPWMAYSAFQDPWI